MLVTGTDEHLALFWADAILQSEIFFANILLLISA